LDALILYIKIIFTNSISLLLKLFCWDIPFKKRGINVMILSIKKLYISREVTFLENEPFYKVGQGDVFDKNISDEFLYPCVTIMETNEPRGELSNIVGEGTLEEESEASQTDENEEVAPLRRSTCQVQPSTRLRDYVTYSVHYSIQDYISYKNISCEHLAFLNNLSRVGEPISFEDAKNEPKWRRAIEEELKALEKKLGKFATYQKIKNLWVINGYTKLNIIMMEPLRDIKRGW
jgi:hypothetical protein